MFILALVVISAGGQGVIAEESTTVVKLENHHLHERNALNRFFNGTLDRQSRLAARKFLARYGHHEEIQSALSVTVPHLGPDNFRISANEFEVLDENGEFISPPMGLIGRRGDRTYVARKQFESVWSEVVPMLCGDEITYHDVKKLETALKAWEEATAFSAKTDPFILRHRCRQHIRKIERVLSAVSDPVRRKELCRLINGGPLEFHGGTVRELIYFLVEHDCEIAWSSQAHVYLTNVARPMEKLVATAQRTEIELEQRLVQSRKGHYRQKFSHRVVSLDGARSTARNSTLGRRYFGGGTRRTYYRTRTYGGGTGSRSFTTRTISVRR